MSKVNILVVDDEEVVRLSHLRSLAEAHCYVEAVWNGDDALRAMERTPFDVVLLDLRMPGSMDGLSVLRAMKERWPDSEVIIVTGYPSLDTAKEAVRLGAYDYLSKPVGPSDVLHATHGAMMQKKWGLHRDRVASQKATGRMAGSRDDGESPAAV
jgi:DNA-binding NtrC family response regulator